MPSRVLYCSNCKQKALHDLYEALGCEYRANCLFCYYLKKVEIEWEKLFFFDNLKSFALDMRYYGQKNNKT